MGRETRLGNVCHLSGVSGHAGAVNHLDEVKSQHRAKAFAELKRSDSLKSSKHEFRSLGDSQEDEDYDRSEPDRTRSKRRPALGACMGGRQVVLLAR